MINRKTLAMLFVALLVSMCFSEQIGAVVLGERSAIASNDVDTDPEQIHISLGSAADSMVVMWATGGYARSKVLYGKMQSQLETVATGDCKQLLVANERGHQFIHRVELHQLEPNTKYFYRVQSSDIFSRIYTFHSLKAGVEWAPNFLVYGDLGIVSNNLKSLIREAQNNPYDAVLHAGDIAYDLDKSGGRVGDRFLREIEPMAAHVPYLTCPGDHERFHNFVHYRFRFSMPGVQWPMPIERLFYSVDIGNVHLISYNTEAYFELDNAEDQLKWLKADLLKANLNRRKVPWIIAMGHKAMYCSDTYPDDCTSIASKVRGGLESLFYESRVDLIIQGHEHAYERMWPLYKGQPESHSYVNPRSPVHLIIGSSGISYISSQFTKQKSDWSAMRLASKEVFGRLKVINATHLVWKAVASKSRQIVDKFTLIKDRHQNFNTYDEVVIGNTTFSGVNELLRNRLMVYVNTSVITVVLLIAVIVIIVLKKRFWNGGALVHNAYDGGMDQVMAVKKSSFLV